MVYFVFYNKDQSFTKFDGIPHFALFYAGLSIFWFSIMDSLDGIRARRLKCGSPLGRMVDEGLDLYFYANFAGFLLWMLQPGPNFWVLFLGLVNLPFHTAEIKFYITKSLNFIVDELGPIEVEFIFGTIVTVSGLISFNFWNVSLASTFGVEWEVFKEIQWKHFLLTLVAILYVLFANDNLKDAFKKNVGRTFYCLVPALIFILTAIGHSFL